MERKSSLRCSNQCMVSRDGVPVPLSTTQSWNFPGTFSRKHTVVHTVMSCTTKLLCWTMRDSLSGVGRSFDRPTVASPRVWNMSLGDTSRKRSTWFAIRSTTLQLECILVWSCVNRVESTVPSSFRDSMTHGMACWHGAAMWINFSMTRAPSSYYLKSGTVSSPWIIPR